MKYVSERDLEEMATKKLISPEERLKSGSHTEHKDPMGKMCEAMERSNKILEHIANSDVVTAAGVEEIAINQREIMATLVALAEEFMRGRKVNLVFNVRRDGSGRIQSVETKGEK